MKKSALLLVAIIIIAGCTASQVDIFLKASPLVSSFLEQYPNAKVTTILVAQGTVQAQIEKIKEDCGPDFPLASYYKTTLDDKESSTMLVVWMDSKNYQMPCAVKESAGVKKEVNANETIEVTTTAAPTTAQQTVSTTPPATAAPPAITTPQATTTTSNFTNAAGAGLPDIIAYVYAYGPPPGTGKINLTGVVENIGSAPSNAGTARFNLTNENTGFQNFADVNVPALAVGEKKYYFPDFSQIIVAAGSYILTINADTTGTTAESNENNNHGATSFGVAYNNTTTSSSTTIPLPDLSSAPCCVNGTIPGIRTFKSNIYNGFSPGGVNVTSTFYIKIEALFNNNTSAGGSNTSAGTCTTSLPSLISNTAGLVGCDIYISTHGSYTFITTVDSTGAIAESNENNNVNVFSNLDL